MMREDVTSALLANLIFKNKMNYCVPENEVRVSPRQTELERLIQQQKLSSAAIDAHVRGSALTPSDSPPPHPSLLLILSQPINSSFPTFVSSTPGMSHLSPSWTFQSLFDVALQDYEKQTGTKLVDHPLAKQLEACDSVATVTTFLQERAQTFHEFRGEDGKFTRSLKRVVHVLYTLSTNAALAESIGLVVCPKIPQKSLIPYETQQPFPPTKAIFAGFAVLLAVHTLSRLHACIFVSYSYISGRLSKTPQRVMMHSWTYSSLWKAFLTDSTFTQNSLLHQSWRRS